MPTLNLTPIYWYQPGPGPGWDEVPATGTDQLFAPNDGKTLGSHISQGGADSSPVQASSFVDINTGLAPAWNNKLITFINVYISAGQLIRPGGATQLQIVAAKASNPNVDFTELAAGTISLTQSPWQLIAGGPVVPPPTIVNAYDRIRDWMLLNDLMYSTLHYYQPPYDASSSQVLLDAVMFEVTYNDIAPPAAKLPFITEL